MLALSYNCSTDEGFQVGAPDEGFDIRAIGTTIEQMEAYVKASIKGDYAGEIVFSTTHDAVGEFIHEIGNGTDHEVVAVVTETFMDETEEVTIPVCLVFKMLTTLLT